jgi:predicted TIM-barrel fold metal-dependent hydrolase
MGEIHFFDCNAFFGPQKMINPGSFYKKEDFLERMSYYGIEKALVHHSMAMEYDAETGDNILIKELEGETKLFPAWVALPHHTGEFPAPDVLIKRMKKNNVRAVILMPASSSAFGHSTEEWSCGELYKMLAEHKVPLFIGADQLPSMDNLYKICFAHPCLNVVLTNVDYRISRDLFPLMKMFKHLFLETSGYIAQDGIEEVCRKFGASRMLYGSNMPIRSGSSALCMISYADISQEEKQMIASGNLENLLGGVQF